MLIFRQKPIHVLYLQKKVGSFMSISLIHNNHFAKFVPVHFLIQAKKISTKIRYENTANTKGSMDGQTWRRLKRIIIVFCFLFYKKKGFSWKLWFFKTFFQSLFLLFATFDIHNALGRYLIVLYEAVNFSFSRKILAIKRCRQKQPDE